MNKSEWGGLTHPDSGGGGNPYGGGNAPSGPEAAPISSTRSASYGRPYPIVYGTSAVKLIPMTVWDRQIQSTILDGVTAQDARCAEVQYAAAFGPIVAWEGVVYGKGWYSCDGLSGLDVDKLVAQGAQFYAPEFLVGDGTHGGFNGEIIAWPMLAMFRARYLAVPGGEGKVPEILGVVRGRFATSLNSRRTGASAWTRYDAAPGDVIRDILENSTYGLGLPAGTVVTAVGADGTAGSSYDRYCSANNWQIALTVDGRASVAEIVDQILTATNSVGVWTGGNFKIIPLGDVAVGTYSPVLSALAITNDDFVAADGEDAIRTTRRAWADTRNVIPVEYSADTAIRDAEMVVTESMDVAHVSLFGVRRGDAVSLPCVRSAEHAAEVSGILARRSCYHRSVFEFRVSARQGAGLECADLVALTHDVMGFADRLARVETIEARSDGTYRVEAREWVTGASVTVVRTPEGPSGLAEDPVRDADNYAAAGQANTAIGLMADDGIISRVEKPLLYNILANATVQWQEINNANVLTALGATETSRLIALFDNLWDYLPSFGFNGNWVWPIGSGGTRTGLDAWMAVDTVLSDYSTTATAFRQAFADAADAHQSMRTQMMSAAAQRKVLAPTGTPSSTTYLRGDGQWATPGGGGTVTSVTGTSPIVSSGGTAPAISINAATSGAAGSMSAADKAKLDAATSSATVSTIAMRDASGWLYAVDVSTSSDRRTKRKVRNLRGALARVLGLRGTSYYRKGDKTKTRRIGLIAQEVREVVPEVVVEDEKGMLSISYGPLVALLIEAIRVIVRRLDRLEARK